MLARGLLPCPPRLEIKKSELSIGATMHSSEVPAGGLVILEGPSEEGKKGMADGSVHGNYY